MLMGAMNNDTIWVSTTTFIIVDSRCQIQRTLNPATVGFLFFNSCLIHLNHHFCHLKQLEQWSEEVEGK
jgi:hypothetical protein